MGDGWPELQLGRRDFFFFTLSLFSACLFSLFFFALFQCCCSRAQVFGKTLVHEFHMFYRHTEWNLLLGTTLFGMGLLLNEIL